jgi:hypothetical protein
MQDSKDKEDIAPLLKLKENQMHEAEKEIDALRKQLVALRNRYDEATQQNELHQQKLHKLAKDYEDKERECMALLRQGERASPLKQQIEAEVNEIRSVTQGLKENNSRLMESLTNSEQHGKQLERVIQYLRERSEESHLEARHLREELRKSQEIIQRLTLETKGVQQMELLLQQPAANIPPTEAQELFWKHSLRSIESEYREIHNTLASLTCLVQQLQETR